MKCRKRTLKTKKIPVDQNSFVPKTTRTSSKKNSSKNGLSVKADLDNLNTTISIVKGMHAILSSKLQSLSIKRSVTKSMAQDLGILSREVMVEIWNAEAILLRLSERLKKSYMGICLH